MTRPTRLISATLIIAMLLSVLLSTAVTANAASDTATSTATTVTTAISESTETTATATASAAAASTSTTASTVFTDVPTSKWYHESVYYATEHGFFNGTSATTFNPLGTMTRGMFVTVLSRLANADTATAKSANFADVDSTRYYASAVNWAYENGYVKGTSATTFSPDTAITREQIATILYQYLAKTQSGVNADTTVLSNYSDAANINAYAKEGVAYMYTSTIMTGSSGAFNPKRALNRAEAAAVFMRLDKIVFGGSSNASGTNETKNETKTLSNEWGSIESSATTKHGGIIENDVITYQSDDTGIDPQKPNGDIAAMSMDEMASIISFDEVFNRQTSDEGLVADGTMTSDTTAIEFSKYIQVTDDIVGILTSKCYIPSKTTYFGRKLDLDIVLYLGDSVTIDCADFGLTPADGYWREFGEGEYISFVSNGDGTATVTATGLNTELSTTSDGIWFDFNTPNNDLAVYVNFTIYKTNPHTTKANFRVETAQYEPIYYCGLVDKSNPSSNYHSRYWAYAKGTTFDPETAYTNVTNKSLIIDYLHIYPSSDFQVNANDLTGDGYIKPEKVDDYFTVEDVTHSGYISTSSFAYEYGHILCVRPMTSSSQNEVTTLKITSNIDGRSIYFDFESRYAYWDY